MEQKGLTGKKGRKGILEGITNTKTFKNSYGPYYC